MIHKMSIVTLALAAGLVAQEPPPEPRIKRRPPEPAPISKPMIEKRMIEKRMLEKHMPEKARRDMVRRGGTKVHVKKMLDLAMELREGGFEEEAQVLLQQAKRLASKTRGKLPSEKRERSAIEEHERRMLEMKLQEAERRAAAKASVRPFFPEVVEVEEVIEEEGEPRRPRALLDGVRTRELRRAKAEREMARRRKVDVARRDSDLDARVERLGKQVQEMRHMIQELKQAIEQGRRGERRMDPGPRPR